MRRITLVLLSACALLVADQGARYLIIAADDQVGAVAPLAEWKTSKGMLAKVVPLSVAGTTPTTVRTYIQNAWNTWPVPPEYVLIACGPRYLRSPGTWYDCRYGDVTGDFHMELPVGRLFTRSARECTTEVRKILAYERPDLAPDTSWLLKGMTIVREDNDPDDSIYWNDSRYCHELWRSAGYLRVDSLSDLRGDSSDDVTRLGSEGTSLITYRGQCGGSFWTPFANLDPFAWTNGAKLPIVIGATCATVQVESTWSWIGDKFVRAVSPSALGGAVAYFGTTMISGGSAQPIRGQALRGFMHALFAEGEFRLGAAAKRARDRVDSLFPGQQERYEEWTLLGDPEMGVWTGVPQLLDVVHDSAVVLGPQDFAVSASRAGKPVAGASVCVSMDTSVYAYGATDDSGRVVLTIDPEHAGSLSVVVTGRNLLPYADTCLVLPTGIGERPGSALPVREPGAVQVFDAAGRRVNRMQAGVYFVREPRTGEASKTVVVR